MDIKWLQDYLTLAEIGNFTRAADARNVSQAAFSRRIQSLEAWLGVTLVDRNVFPAALTPAGRRFAEHAGEILKQIFDARGELSGRPAVDHLRIAMPYALATSSLPAWWTAWTQARDLSCSIVLGNVHDMVTSLASGSVDLLICFHNMQQPIQLDQNVYERHIMLTETVRPYASQSLLERVGAPFPGRPGKPLPLLMYSPGVFFARLVDLVVDAAPEPLHGRRIMESDMSDVLATMARAGHGIAWLPDCTVDADESGLLIPVGDENWGTTVSTVAFRNRSNERTAVNRLWAQLLADAGHRPGLALSNHSRTRFAAAE